MEAKKVNQEYLITILLTQKPRRTYRKLEQQPKKKPIVNESKGLLLVTLLQFFLQELLFGGRTLFVEQN